MCAPGATDKDVAVALDRPDGDALGIVRANIEAAVSEDLDARSTAMREFLEREAAAQCPLDRAATNDESGIVGVCASPEGTESADRTTESPPSKFE